MAAVHRIVLIHVLALIALGARAQVPAFELIALTNDNALHVFPANSPQTARAIKVSGVDGRIVGIDVRPADNKLYGLSEASTLYTLDARSGLATKVSRLGTAFRGGTQSGFDFNPQADRLRLVATTGQNLRINVEVGAVAIDGALAFGPDDLHAGDRPAAIAAGYTNSIANARSTVLFLIDHAADILVKQDPPNDGVLTTIGKLGIDCGPDAGFDIVTSGGADYSFALCAGRLYTLDLKTGAANEVGLVRIGEGTGATYVGLAGGPLPSAPSK